MSKKAVVLLSGGLDSATTLAIAKSEGYDPYVMSFNYGQRHAVELTCAELVAQHARVKQHKRVFIDLKTFGGSALTADIDVPKNRTIEEMSGRIPVMYVPARNTIMLSYALAWSEVLGANAIFIGSNALDYAGYPDCRPEYMEAYEKMANLATQAGVEEQKKLQIKTPVLHKTKAEIIKIGHALGVDYSLTSSCYDPSLDGRACGECDACILRREGFKEAGIKDPTVYLSKNVL